MLAAEIVLVLLASGMVAATAFLIRWAADARTPLRASTVLFLLLMMVAMVAGAAIYYTAPGPARLVEGFWVASGLMSVSVVLVFAGFLEEVRRRASRGPTDPPPVLRHPRTFVAAVIATVLANEFLMGWTFSAAAGATIPLDPAGLAAFGVGLAQVVVSPWFLFTMSAEMLLTAYLLRDRLSPALLTVLLSQSAIMFLSPPALGDSAWTAATVYGGSGLMIGLIVFVMEHLYRTREAPRAFLDYLVRLLGLYALMMAGLYLWWVYAFPAAFALSVVLEMVLYFELVVRPERIDPSTRVAWQDRPHWTFALLSTIFVAELFMGALLDAQASGSAFVSGLPALPWTGTLPESLYAAFYNGFWFFAAVTASTGFLAMMGIEMGALVVFKLRETRSRETRIRLALMLGCYGAFAVFFPSLYYPLLFPRAPTGASVPVLGWSMGIGSAPLAVGVFGVVLATYAIVGVASFLFGRRAVCSTFCTAPLMYQGTTIDAMKSFNRSSPLARKFLSSRFSAAYSVTLSVVMISLGVASVASVLDQAGLWTVTVLGSDPTVFLFALYFSVLWYVLFVTIPYTGNYNCVTMGWCYTGAISQAFGRVGFFRLRVHSREVCQRCTTLDCAQSCPVGLVDMPGHFRRKGEFRSSKCCGVGDCVESCPYGNMYLYDVRHWVRERFGLVAHPRGEPLPMVRPRAVGSHATRTEPAGAPSTAGPAPP